MRRITKFVQLIDPHSYRDNFGEDEGDRRADKVVLSDQSHKKDNPQSRSKPGADEKLLLGIESGKKILKDCGHEKWDQSQSEELHCRKSREKSRAQGQREQRL